MIDDETIIGKKHDGNQLTLDYGTNTYMTSFG